MYEFQHGLRIEIEKLKLAEEKIDTYMKSLERCRNPCPITSFKLNREMKKSEYAHVRISELKSKLMHAKQVDFPQTTDQRDACLSEALKLIKSDKVTLAEEIKIIKDNIQDEKNKNFYTEAEAYRF